MTSDDTIGSFPITSYAFTGRRLDAETGLYYYRARYYKPEIGRFLQTDPIGYEGGLNMYAYVGNNPIMWTDPFGLDVMGIHGDEDHSWVSYTTDDGVTTTYGLWHLGHVPTKGKIRRVMPGGDVWEGAESRRTSTASRYYDLSDTEEAGFRKWLDIPHRYRRPWNNCSSWASDTARKVVGEDVDADSWLGFELPKEVVESIRKLEKSDPTSSLAPKGEKDSGSSSSSSSSW